MNEATIEHLLVAVSAGVITFIVTFATLHYINPSIKSAIR